MSAHSKENYTFLVVSCSVSGQLEDFSCKIFEDSCKVDYIHQPCDPSSQV
jgi:hypothetical protein